MFWFPLLFTVLLPFVQWKFFIGFPVLCSECNAALFTFSLLGIYKISLYFFLFYLLVVGMDMWNYACHLLLLFSVFFSLSVPGRLSLSSPLCDYSHLLLWTRVFCSVASHLPLLQKRRSGIQCKSPCKCMCACVFDISCATLIGIHFLWIWIL